MPRQSVTSGWSARQRFATAERMNHLRTHHTTPSRSRGTVVGVPLMPRWRDPQLARANLSDFVV